ncbi:MAG: hypothetical protein ABIG44_01935 [Planctomycetota bacterium]
MNRRIWKWAGLAAVGGFVLQGATSCSTLAETVITQLLPVILSQLVQTATT